MDKGRNSSQTKEKEVKFEEPVIPARLRRWSADLSQIAAYLVPGQDMANVFAREFHLAEKKGPPSTPLVCPDLSKRPWCAPLGSHERSNKSWRDSVARKHKDSPQQISLQSYLLYNLRFLLTGDMLVAWHSFGGLSAQWYHISIVLHLAVVESVTFALIYDQELRSYAQRQARRRDTETDFYRLFSEENDEIERTLKTERGKKLTKFKQCGKTKNDPSNKGQYAKKGVEKGKKRQGQPLAPGPEGEGQRERAKVSSFVTLITTQSPSSPLGEKLDFD